jgi:hypothetical protein
MACDLTPAPTSTRTPRPGELWQSTTAHAWRVRVLKVSRNGVCYRLIVGPGSRRKQEHWMSLPAFQNCYHKLGR